MQSLLEAAANARAGLGGLGDGGENGMEIDDLGLVVGDFGVLGFVMDLHSFRIRDGEFAVRTLPFSVAAFLFTGAIHQTSLATASVGGGGVLLRREFLRRVLLRLRLACHREFGA